mmetsp:Transcript_18725/g.42581  ORF Transcript_18725/g.42581 Transcript_18725/m.42581 type:complete len:267 (+) Transcript_18725:1-801(+)
MMTVVEQRKKEHKTIGGLMAVTPRYKVAFDTSLHGADRFVDVEAEPESGGEVPAELPGMAAALWPQSQGDQPGINRPGSLLDEIHARKQTANAANEVFNSSRNNLLAELLRTNRADSGGLIRNRSKDNLECLLGTPNATFDTGASPHPLHPLHPVHPALEELSSTLSLILGTVNKIDREQDAMKKRLADLEIKLEAIKEPPPRMARGSGSGASASSSSCSIDRARSRSPGEARTKARSKSPGAMNPKEKPLFKPRSSKTQQGPTAI